MNTPITWSDIAHMYIAYIAVGAITPLILSVIAWLALDNACKTCGAKLQWRWRKPHEYSARRFCPYHDGRPWE